MRGYNAGSAQLGLNNGAGKGDADRSPGWREHYDEIDWGGFAVNLDEGHKNFRITKPVDATFERRGNKLIKKYGRTN